MKLRLPFSLLSAVLAVFTIAASGAHAVEVPEDYTSNYLADPDELYDFRSGNEKVAFLLDGSVVVSPSSATWWQSGALMSEDSVLFTIEEDGDPFSMTFKDGSSYPAFYRVANLGFHDIGVITFQNIGDSCGAIYNVANAEFINNRSLKFTENSTSDDGGAIYATNLTIEKTKQTIIFSGNSAGDGISNYGGAIHAGNVSICDNSGNIEFCDNYIGKRHFSNRDIDYYGGAVSIYSDSTLSICNNRGGVSFSSNYVKSSASGHTYTSSGYYYYYKAYSKGGAIYGASNTVIDICSNNESVLFENNYVLSSGDSLGNVGDAHGGAIYIGTNSTLNIKSNKGVTTFTGNYAKAVYVSGRQIECSSSFGGAIYLENNSNLNICDNVDTVLFTGNSAYYGGAIHVSAGTVNLAASVGDIVFRANSATYGGAISSTLSQVTLAATNGSIVLENNTAASNGGAIYSNANIDICNNAGAVSFLNNTASQGGAIYEANGIISICNNTGTIKFTGNTATTGAAIYGNSLVIQNNESVIFERNLENENRLRSIYLNSTSTNGGKFHVSAAKEKSITFTDGIYVATSTSGMTVDVVFNGNYIASDESEIEQGGDIIFDGGQVETELTDLLGTTPTTQQITNSLTSYIGGVINLKAGRMIVRNGAQFNGIGISTTARSNAAVVLDGAGMNHSSGSINIRRGTSLELSGYNQISTGSLSLASGSTLLFTICDKHLTTAALTLDANLEHFSINLALPGQEMLASGRYKLVELADAAQYASEDYWNADDITVTATGDAAGLGFDDLVWEDGVLYVEQGKSFWNNAAGDMSWNTASVNWVRNDVGIAYKNGMDVEFGDAGAGIVQLAGEIAPLSVVVENSAGHDYTFTGSGKLTGATSLTKTGTGELSLATANEHTGGTVVDGGTLRVQHSTALGAADATVTTAAGTLLSVENNAAVVLAAATGNSLAGRVLVQTGASLEVQGTGYHAEATQLEGELIFSGAGVNHTGEGAGTLSGSGQLKVQGSGSSAQFSSAADYTGHVALADGAEFTADKLVMKADTTLAAVAAGTSLGLEDIVQPGTAQVEMHTTRFDSYTGTLHTDVAANSYSAGTLALVDGLTLEGGSTYQADGSSLNLNGGSLTLSSGSGSDMFVNLMLSLDGAYMPEVTQIVLFTGVAEFCLGGQVLSTGDTTHVFAATDYLTGDYVYETTALVYDGNVGCVYLVEAIPEPTTTTLSLLALAGLAARRRRR